jgi:hypothetical protein
MATGQMLGLEEATQEQVGLEDLAHKTEAMAIQRLGGLEALVLI